MRLSSILQFFTLYFSDAHHHPSLSTIANVFSWRSITAIRCRNHIHHSTYPHHDHFYIAIILCISCCKVVIFKKSELKLNNVFRTKKEKALWWWCHRPGWWMWLKLFTRNGFFKASEYISLLESCVQTKYTLLLERVAKI